MRKAIQTEIARWRHAQEAEDRLKQELEFANRRLSREYSRGVSDASKPEFKAMMAHAMKELAREFAPKVRPEFHRFLGSLRAHSPYGGPMEPCVAVLEDMRPYRVVTVEFSIPSLHLRMNLPGGC